MNGYIDMHCDTLLRMLDNKKENLYENSCMVDFKRMKEAGQLAQFFAVFFPPRVEGKASLDFHRPALPPDDKYFDSLVHILKENLAVHEDIIAMAGNYDEIQKNAENGKMSAILTVEDGRAIQGSMEKLEQYYEAGVRAIALTWNYENCFGYPNATVPELMEKGLKPFGKEAVVRMNELGILVDVSHLSDGGFADVARISKKPFVATHSNCRELAPHQRNLTDAMIRTIANAGGVAGLNFAPSFLTKDVNNNHTTIEMLTAHVFHMMNVGGEEVLALGTDFDGISGTFEVGDPTKMEKLFESLKKKGITERQMDKFKNENVLRVIREVC